MRALAGQLLNSSALKANFALNGDIFVRTLTLMSAFAAFTSLSSVLGTMTLAENALLLQVVSLAAFFIDGLAFATESLAGIFLGKKANARLASLVRISGVTSLISGASPKSDSDRLNWTYLAAASSTHNFEPTLGTYQCVGYELRWNWAL